MDNTKVYIFLSRLRIGFSMVEFQITGKEMIAKGVKLQSTSGVIYVPKSWVGHRVIVILDGE